jgi:hypothetical protein
LLFAASFAWAQTPSQETGDDLRRDPAELRQERRERIREARQERRERVQEAREERRQANRERMERFRERFRGDGVHLRIFRDYTLAEGETSNEPIVVIGGSVRIDGRVDDDVVVVGGGLHLGPKAIVEGNAVSVMGEIELEPGAAVHGSIDEAVAPWGSITFGTGWNSEAWWRGLSFWGSMFRLSLTLAVAVFLTLAAPGWIGTISDRSAGASILTGLAVEVLFVPALVVLVAALIVSIVGIPLLATIPLLLAAFAFIWIAGFTGVAVRLGRALRGKGPMTAPSVMDFLLGYAIIIGLTVIAQATAYGFGWLSPTWPMRSAGLLVEYVAWTIGLGAAVTSLFTGQRVLPPPLPV